MSSPRDTAHDDGDGSSPKRFKADSDQSDLPSGILRDEPQPEADSEDSSNNRKARKSIGRRVSFAPTAHVRMFEIPEDKQATPLLKNNNTFAMPDISSQTGMVGFSLGPISTIEETSMASNESFDVSVRHSDPSDSIHSNESSFASNGRQTESISSGDTRRLSGISEINAMSYANMLDDDDDDDDLESDGNDMDDDPVTMELTGTVDMCAINGYDDDEAEASNGVRVDNNGLLQEYQATDGVQGIGAIGAGSTNGGNGLMYDAIGDANNFLNMLLQGNTTSNHTGLLDSIMSQFESTEQLTSVATQSATTAMDLDPTQVDMVASNAGYSQDDIEPTLFVSAAPGYTSQTAADDDAMDEDTDDSDSDDDDNANDDAVTMELTGIVDRRPDSPIPTAPQYQSQPQTQPQPQPATPVAATSSAPIARTPLGASAGAIQPEHTGIEASASMESDAASIASPCPTLVPVTPIPPTTPRTPVALPFSAVSTPTPVATAGTPTTPVVLSSSTIQTPATARTGAYTPLFSASTPVPTTTPLIAATTPLVFSTDTPASATGIGPRAPLSASEPITASTPLSGPATPAVKTPSRRASRQRRRSSQINPDSSEQPEPTFELDALPPMPSSPAMPVPTHQHAGGHPSLIEIAKAGLVFKIFNAYHKHRLQPTVSDAALGLSGINARFEPLFRKAKLNARLEYCSSLSSMFEADHDVSQTADAIPTDFDPTIEFFEEQNELLAQRRDELQQLIAKAKQKCLQEAPSEDKGRLAGEIKDLRTKLADIRREREATAVQVEALGSEIQSLRTTSSSFGRQFTEKKGLQNILLAINGLQLTDAAEDHCEFVYDTFSKIHLDSAAEFTSLHPDIDWSAVIRDSINSSNMSTRQYAISVMKTNAVIKKLLEDVKHVKQMTFVDLQHSGGIQVRIQFFSREHRQRFYLNIAFDSIDAYRQIHQKPGLEWSTEVVYGSIDMARLEKCVTEARISSEMPLLSIYNHIESQLGAF
ncbi:hypothetical protein GGI15_002653 [Coemansia interrupta]|uniref:Spc7 kinetochore protein domain-containing protein n=1 Tax=Coemansia interrupta TaxID=1126814 RepID=A0A9W8LKT7_9FUNG|nr:hypothetical protein GGI15_002653 [Coemansia interrupta]